jgi:DNA-binding response OmpR family regulator
MTLQRRKVLVVEDEHRIREILEFLLRRAGFVVEGVGDGQAALDRLEIEPFDLVVTDFVMPRVPGIGVIRRLRARGNTTPVLLLSATVTAAALNAARRYGAVEVLAKPFSIDEFRERVEALLAFQGSNGGRAS